MTKKLLTAITSLLVFSAVAVSAMFCTPAFAALVGDDGVAADAFSPKKFTATKASGTISVDGSETAENAYGSNTINVNVPYGGAGFGDTGTKAVAHVAWDDTYIYIHMNVTDSTNGADPDGSFDSDSIEFYLDFDNNKTKYNRLGSNANGIYAGQYRVQRGSTNSKITDIAVTPTEEMRKLAEQSKVAVKEKSGGYIVEVAMPHKNYALSKNIGFALQINDADEPGSRKGVMYSSDPIQYFAYRYTFLFDTLTLEGFTLTTSRTKAADDVDDAGSSGSASTASSGSTSSRPSSTSSKPSSSAATSSAAATASVTSSNTSATANTSSVSSDVTASAESTEAAADLNDSEAAENEQQTGTTAEKNKGGLSTGAIIGIVAGAVVILAAAAAVVLILLKKKSASVEADGQDDEPDNADENSDSGQDEQ